MPELSTLGGVIKPTYEGESNTNAFTDPEKAKLAGLADVATSGDYADLTGKPTIPSGNYADLTGRPTLSPVATSGAYADLSGRPDVILRSERGAANGVAPLDAAGMVPMIHLNVSGLSFKGAWNPTTNTPTLVDGTGAVGDFYKASTAGTFNFGNGSFSFNEGDWAIFAGGVWQRIGSNELVQSVNGQLGDVVLDATDVGLGALPDTYAPTWDDVADKPALPTFPAGSVVGPAVPAFLIRRTTPGSFQAGAARHIAWDSVVYDPFSGFAGDGRYTVPAWAGFARITVSVKLAQSSATGSYLFAYAYVNDAEVDQHGAATVNGTRQSERLVTSIFPVAPGDSLSSRVWHNFSANRGLEIGSTGSFMQIELFEAMS